MKTTKIRIAIGLAILSTFVFGYPVVAQPALPPGEGFVEVTGGRVWYRVVGEGERTPLLLLHGGPGVPSYYLNPLAALGADRPIIFVDQLGCGRSDHHTDTTLMTVNQYVEQLEQIRLALGLEAFYLYGHSWGTMLGTDYYLKYPQAVRGLIFAGSAISAKRWAQDADTLITTLPDTIQAAIKVNTRNGTFDTPKYQQALLYYYERFVARKLPWGPNLDSAFSGINPAIYEYMWGPSEFTATGTLQNYDRTDQLGKIQVPTLFICGEYDEARPATTRYYQSLVPNAQYVVIDDAAHITMHDQPDRDVEEIRHFLDSIESSSVKQ